MSARELLTGADVRRVCRGEQWLGPTAALAPGYAQANLVVVPKEHAFDFLLFAHRNPRPCPVLAVTDPGRFDIPELAAGADLRTDLPRYRVWEEGELVDEPTDILNWWRDDLVSFLIGCSFTFDAALVEAGVPVRHMEAGTNVPMYGTNRPCRPAGRFEGPLVVSMRPFSPEQVEVARSVTRQFPHFHGEPVHAGDPLDLGIRDLNRPDFGNPVPINKGEVPVFWACGVTPQCALMNARLPIAITHSPGHMFVTDRRNVQILSERAD
jgi:uncharacterized protein YcsI (UPF0317 family)